MSDDVDPRFDPRFQRGYDPERHATRERRTDRSAEHRADPPRADRIPPPPMAPRDPIETPTEPTRDEGPAVDSGPQRNRPLVALLVGGIGLVVAAIAMLLQAALDSTPVYAMSPRPWAPVWGLLRQVLPEPMLEAGIVAIAVWVAVRTALRDRR